MDDLNERFEKALEQRNQMMDDHGWIADAVFDAEDCERKLETGRDVHTHGLVETYGHRDLQCILPIDPKIIHSIFCIIVEKIKLEKTFEAGKCYGDIIKDGYKVRFVEAKEGNRKVLRMILPDSNGKLHKNLMEESFKIQYNGLKGEEDE